ncbi:MAG: type II toxin-antitoxin system HicA family toxin [Bacteroidia bacterium]|nr:type II toxin-antitoxin system HicA family toxin [Bacteroidia bacterium]
MKRYNLIRHLRKNGCHLLREGAKHCLYVNPANNKISTVPRHREIKKFTAKQICRDLDIEVCVSE